jgi:hypothetical protein
MFGSIWLAAEAGGCHSNCTEINVDIVLKNVSDHIPGNQQNAPGWPGNDRAPTMDFSYLDLFLAFIGLVFGVPSALPHLFFRSEDPSRRRAP